MGFGRTLPEGSLPVFSVTTEREAKELIALTCPINLSGQHYARELAQEQTLENLKKFSDKLAKAHDLLVKNGRCRCKKKGTL